MPPGPVKTSRSNLHERGAGEIVDAADAHEREVAVGEAVEVMTAPVPRRRARRWPPPLPLCSLCSESGRSMSCWTR